MSVSEYALALSNVRHQYHKKNASGPVLSIPQWQVKQGDHVFLHGDSGSGKSTLLNLLSGVLTPTSGSINLLGQDICQLSSAKRDAFRANHIGVVFQTFNLIPYLPVIKNIQLAAYFAGKKSANKDMQAVRTRAEEMLSHLNLSVEVLDKPVNQLSIGQQQRVAIVRALVNAPEILLVDEPTSALDASARDAFMKVLLSVSKEAQTTLIFVSHDQSLRDYFSIATDIQTLFEEPSAHPNKEPSAHLNKESSAANNKNPEQPGGTA